MNDVPVGNVYRQQPSPPWRHDRRTRACTFRVILSLKDKRTTAEALLRNGVTYLASEGRLHRAWRQPACGGLVAGLNSQDSIVRAASLSIFGGLTGLDQTGSRMFAAPLSLDPSANQEEGDP